ncbi:MAG TPA: ABC transporter ATP-binding protein [Dermatophilaceae bacterium]|nr:ABC transporter ATP-binding protein [Dermatophilaceae bacterium]
MTQVSLSGVTKAFAGTTVLHGVNLVVPTQRLTAVLGPSGCGKTTMLRLVAGFADPDAGQIRLGDTVVAGPGVRVPARRRRVGYVPQEGALFPHLSVAENVGFGLPRGVRRAGTRVEQLLELVGLERSLRERAPHELSGGQQQRVALARALAPSPEVVLLDEPFASLDAGLREGTGRAVAAALSAAGATGVLVTHDQAEALSLADQVAVMRAGRIAQVGTPQQVYAAPADLDVALFVGAAVVLPAEVSGGVARTVLGPVPVEPRTAHGPARVMLRPEQLMVGDTRGPLAQVEEIRFYGHDCAVRLRLLDGVTVVVARLSGGQAPPRQGDRVPVGVTGRGLAFPAP